MLTAWAIKVAESDLFSCPSVCKKKVQAISVENVSTRDADAWLFAKFTRETNAT